MFTAALAGSWLALPPIRDPRSNPAIAFVLSLVVWLSNLLLLRLRWCLADSARPFARRRRREKD